MQNHTEREEESDDGPACVHTYIASEVALFPGDSELAGKAWQNGEGVAASVLAMSEQNIPAVWLLPWLAPPTRCSHESRAKAHKQPQQRGGGGAPLWRGGFTPTRFSSRAAATAAADSKNKPVVATNLS